MSTTETVPRQMIIDVLHNRTLGGVIGVDYEPRSRTAMLRAAEAVVRGMSDTTRLPGTYLVTRHGADSTTLVMLTDMTAHNFRCVERKYTGYGRTAASNAGIRQQLDLPLGAPTRTVYIDRHFKFTDGRRITQTRCCVDQAGYPALSVACTYQDDVWLGSEVFGDGMREGLETSEENLCRYLAARVPYGRLTPTADYALVMSDMPAEDMSAGDTPRLTVLRPRNRGEYRTMLVAARSDIWECYGSGYALRFCRAGFDVTSVRLADAVAGTPLGVPTHADGTGFAPWVVRLLRGIAAQRPGTTIRILSGDAALRFLHVLPDTTGRLHPTSRAHRLSMKIQAATGWVLGEAAYGALYSAIKQAEVTLRRIHTQQCNSGDRAGHAAAESKARNGVMSALSHAQSTAEWHGNGSPTDLAAYLDINTDPRGPAIQFAFGPEHANNLGGNFVP